MLSTIPNWLSGGIVKQFTGPLLDAYQAKLNAENDTQKIEAERQIAFWERQVEASREGTQRQSVKMNQPVFWFIMCVALLPGLGTFLLLAVYNVLWHKAGIWPQPWNIAAFPPPYDAWAQMSIEWVFDPVKLAATTATAAAGGYLTGRR